MKNYSTANAAAERQEGSAHRGGLLVPFPTTQGAPASTAEFDPLDQPVVPPEPEPPDDKTRYATRVDEALEALMQDPRIDLDANVQHFLKSLYALSDGRKRFATTYRTLAQRAPNQNTRSAGAGKSWVKRNRRQLEQRQADVGILLVEIVSGGVRRRSDGGDDIRFPSEYVMHITK